MAARGDDHKAVVEESVLINAPQKKIFEFLSDFANYKKMSEAFHESRQTSEGDFGAGAKGIRKASLFGRDIELVQEVTVFEPPERIVIRNSSAIVQTSDEFILKREGKGTLVTLRVEGDTGGFMSFMVSMASSFAQRQIRKDLKKLKKIMEGA